MRLLHSNGTSQMIKEPTREAQRLNQNGALDQYNDLNPQSRNPAIARVKGQRPYKGEAWGVVYVRDLKCKKTQPAVVALQNGG